MILEVRAYSREIANDGNAEPAHLVGRADPREQQDMGRANGSAAQYDFPLCPLLMVAVILVKADGYGAPAFEQNPADMYIREYLDIAPSHNRAQEGMGCAVPASILLGYLVEPEPLLRGAVEIRIARKTSLLRRIHKGVRHRIQTAKIGYIQGASRGVVFRGAALLILRFLEIRQNVGKAPARVSQVMPGVIIAVIASDIDHGIDRAASAQDLAAGPIQFAVLQLRLSLSVERPVTGALKQL